MNKVFPLLLAVALLVCHPLAAAVAGSIDDVIVKPDVVATTPDKSESDINSNQNVSVTTSTTTVDVSSGIPETTSQDAVDKANRITGKIHSMAVQVMPGIAMAIIVICVILGIFWGAARKAALFALVALAVVILAPFLVSLAVSLINA